MITADEARKVYRQYRLGDLDGIANEHIMKAAKDGKTCVQITLEDEYCVYSMTDYDELMNRSPEFYSCKYEELKILLHTHGYRVDLIRVPEIDRAVKKTRSLRLSGTRIVFGCVDNNIVVKISW